MAGIKHEHVATQGDSGDASLLQPSDWNASHISYMAPPGTIVAVTTTVQAAIDAASAGSTVYVPAGTYTEDVVCKDGVNLVGPSFAGTYGRNVAPTAFIDGIMTPASNMTFADLKLAGNDAYFGWYDALGLPTTPMTITGCYLERCRFTGGLTSLGSTGYGTVFFADCNTGLLDMKFKDCYFETPDPGSGGTANTISVYGRAASSVGRTQEAVYNGLLFDGCYFAASTRYHIETFQAYGTLATNSAQPFESWKFLRMTNCYFSTADYAHLSLVSSMDGLNGEESYYATNALWSAGYAEIDHNYFEGWGSSAMSPRGAIELNGIVACHVHHNMLVASTGYEGGLINGSLGATPADGGIWPLDKDTNVLSQVGYVATRHRIEYNHYDGRESKSSGYNLNGAQWHSSHNTFLTRGDTSWHHVCDSVFEFDNITRFYRDGDMKYPWVTGTSYALGALVEVGGLNYRCISAHTSGTWATDLAYPRWQRSVAFGSNYTAQAGEMDVSLTGLFKAVHAGDYLIDENGWRYFVYAVGTPSGSTPSITQTVSIVRGLRANVSSGDPLAVESLTEYGTGVTGRVAYLTSCNNVKIRNCIFRGRGSITVYCQDNFGSEANTTDVAFDTCVFYGESGFDAVTWAAGSSGSETYNREITLT